MMRHLVAFLLLSAAVLSIGTPANASEVVWSALVYASNKEVPEKLPKELEGFAGKLERIFGYTHFELLSEHREIMDKKTEGWLLPGKGFYLRVNATESPSPGFSMDLQLYQEKRLLVETQATLARQSPIFVRGPLCEDGQLIIVLVVK